MKTDYLFDEEFTKPFALIKGMARLPGFKLNMFDLALATALVNVLALALPLTLMQTYDRIIPNHATGSLMWLVTGCLIAMIFEFVTRITRSFISGWLAARFEHQVSCAAIEKLIKSHLREYELYSVGTHMDRMNAVYTLKRFYAGQLFQVILDLPFSIIFLVVIWLLGKTLVFVPISIILFMFIVFYLSRIGFQRTSVRQVAATEKRFDLILKILRQIHLVKSLTLEEQMLRKHDKAQEDTAKTTMDVSTWSMLPTNLGNFFSQISIFSVIIIGSLFVIEGELTLGIVTACGIMSTRALTPMQSFISFWLRFTEAKIAKNRLNEIAEMELERQYSSKNIAGEIDGAISYQKVTLRDYYGEKELLKASSMSIKAREFVTVELNNPQDATQFLLSMMGKTLIQSGEICIDEYDISEWDITRSKGIIEYVSSQGTLFSGTILENITLFDPFRTFTANGIARLMGIDEEIAKLPKGYQTKVDHKTTFLSTGLIQRIALARSLVVRPRILILDRVDELMDRKSLRILHLFLSHFKNRCTIILVSNSPELKSLSDRVISIENGTFIDQPV